MVHSLGSESDRFECEHLSNYLLGEKYYIASYLYKSSNTYLSLGCYKIKQDNVKKAVTWPRIKHNKC